jgi:hypothetical protein
MADHWQHLTELTRGREVVVERVRMTGVDIAIEGRFELPPLARLDAEDQVFVAAFVRSHGSIKKMEQLFGVSYPTIKNRLNRIGAGLDFVGVESMPPPAETVLSRLEQGEITAAEALKELGR